MSKFDHLIVRKFTKELEVDKNRTVYDLFEWKTVDVILRDYRTNKVICDMRIWSFNPLFTECLRYYC